MRSGSAYLPIIVVLIGHASALLLRLSNTSQAKHGQAKSPIELVVLITAPRSASTFAAELLAEHPCGVSFHEFFTTHGGDIFVPPGGQTAEERRHIWAPAACKHLPDADAAGCNACNVNNNCGSDIWKQVHKRPLWTLLQTRKAFCQRQRHPQDTPPLTCGSTCVVNVKVFPDNLNSTGVTELLEYSGTKVLLLERDAAASQCSLNYSMQTDIWHGGDPKKEEAYQKEHCASHASPDYAEWIRSWYQEAASTLKKLRKSYLSVSFDDLTGSPDIQKRRMQEYAGLV